MSGEYKNFRGSLTVPSRRVIDVVPSDGANLERDVKSLYVGGSGDVSIITVDGDERIFKGVPAGTTLPVMVRKVYALNTTATFILGYV